jgi:FkbM family methyltransferase
MNLVPDLAVVARMNEWVAAQSALELEAFWDGMYGWKVGNYRIPDPEMPLRKPEDLVKRAAIVEKYRKDVNDYWFRLYKPRAGDVIVDIGAGRGEDVFVFAEAVGPEGEVWAVEPHPVSYLALRKLCEWNGLKNVKCFGYASTSEPAQLQIETMAVWESNYIRPGEATATSFAVEGIPFDQLAAREGLGEVSYLKMNIEGAEREALPGCRAVLERTRNVTIAAHDFRADRGEGESFRTLGFVREFLTGNGFALTTRDDDPRYYVPSHVHGRRG